MLKAKGAFAVAKAKMGVWHKRDQFKIVAGVMAVVVAAVVGYTVWFALDSRQAADTAYKGAESASESMSQAAAKDQPSIVADATNGSADLAAFLRSDNEGCRRSSDVAWFRVVKEVNNAQATVEYGCSKTYNAGNGTPARMLVHKVDGTWKPISPTNQWVYNTPSCSMLQANQILTALEPGCWSGQSTAGVTVVPNLLSQYATNYATCVLASGSTVVATPPAVCITKDHVVFEK